MIEKAIYQRLAVDFAGLVALTSTRVYPNDLPQDVQLPAIRFARVSGSRLMHMEGPSYLANPRFQIDAYSTHYHTKDANIGVTAVAQQIRKALDGFKGTVTYDTLQTVKIGMCRLLNDRDIYESETRLHRVIMDFMFWHAEEE